MNKADAIKKARAAKHHLRGIPGEAAAYAFYLTKWNPRNLKDPSWWTLSLAEKRGWAGDTPLSFVGPVVEIKPGEIDGCHHCGRPFAEVAV